TGHNFDARADAVTIGADPDQSDLKPMIAGAAIVQQQLRLLAIVAHQNIEVPIVIDIRQSRSPTHARKLKIRSEFVTHVLKDTTTGIAIEKLRLRVTSLRVVQLNVVQNMPVSHEYVARSVVVVIDEKRTEAAVPESRVTEFGRKCGVLKSPVAQISI